MRLSSFSLRWESRRAARDPLRLVLPLVAGLAFGCSNNGQSIANLSPAEIASIYSNLARKDYHLMDVEVNRREAAWLCTTDCDVVSREESGGFNSERAVVIIDVLPKTGGDYYHAYAHNKESGRLLWEGIGDSRNRTFVIRDENGGIKAVKKARREDGAWITVKVSGRSITTDPQNATELWKSAVTDFKRYASLE